MNPDVLRIALKHIPNDSLMLMYHELKEFGYHLEDGGLSFYGLTVEDVNSALNIVVDRLRDDGIST